MCLKLFWSKNSSTDGGTDVPYPKNKVLPKPPSRDRDDIETSTYNPNPYNEAPPKSDNVPSPPPPPPQKKPHSKPPPPIVSEETYYPTKGGGGGGYVDEDSKSDAAYEVSESTTLKGVHGVVGERHFNGRG
ncbi:hypothetical protein QJS10_CPB14g00411 [Acorus calamus]|uniref:Uncharacterized protein n=1 Tax=Acorus calamus TaxID=4465 RepID=A0AAV9DC16_ACOCL|nr:hypothetical protein QJS10_CPB14g00411 [Acorus calamus]